MSSFKAVERRKKTLLVEYQNQFKANKFLDKRLGENDPGLTLEDKMFKRFERQRQKTKVNRYNLNEDDGGNEDDFGGGAKVDLTHYGQSLAQIEKFERVGSSDEEDMDDQDPNSDRGKINAKIVSENFFGGGEDADKKKARKDWIEEMIAKSKQIKYERQKERDKTLDMTDELDKEWRNIMPLLSKMNTKLKEEAREEAAEKSLKYQ